MTIPKFLYDSRIYNLVSDLVSEGYVNYDEIPTAEKDNIVIKIIEVLGSDAYNLIIGHDDFDKTLNYFSNFLKTANHNDAYNLLYQMRKNAIDQYEYELNNLFIEIVENRKDDEVREKGLVPIICKQTGELSWGRQI